jgi:hypothetical protein
LARWTRSKLLWVHRALARKEALAPKVRAPEFVSGENFSYLGQNYRLKIVRDAAEPLRLDGNHFWLAEDARSEAEVHFRRWYTASSAPTDYVDALEIAPVTITSQVIEAVPA